jgi:4a-hydroxytetrahydrobiopterin dehydratase
MPELSYEKLSEEQVAEGLNGLPGWSIEGGTLVREFSFPTYSRGLLFASACGHIAETLDHHPDLFVGYQTVRVAFVTHSAGGLTAYDFEAARRVQALA